MFEFMRVAGLFENESFSGDADTFTDFGFYSTGSTATNTPFNYCIILTIPSPSAGIDMCFQLAVERNIAGANTPRIAVRAYRGSDGYGWSSWKEL